MAFTKIVAAGINTGSSYTFQDLNTVGIVTAGTVQVGAATTVHTTGIDLGSGNITSHNINSTGIITATSFVGSVTGDITGNITGDITGNVTGNADTASNLTGSPSITVGNITASGNVSIAGTLTYEDVTNIDSIGIVTAQAGIYLDDSIIHLGDTNTKIRFPAADTITAETAGSERFRITSAGQVVVNRSAGAVLTDSSSKLEVFNSAENLILVSNSTAATGQDAGIMFAPANNVYGGKIIVTSDEDFSTSANRTAHMAFYTRKDGTASEKLRITSDGLVGIGTNSPVTNLTVYGNTSAALFQNSNTGTTAGDGFFVGNYGGLTASVWQYENDNITFGTNNIERLKITNDGKFHTGNPSGLATDDFNITSTGTGGTLSLNRAQSGNASDGDLLGAVSFQSYPSGSGFASAESAIRAYAETGQSGSAAPSDLRFYTKPSSSGPGGSPKERLRIRSNGDLILGPYDAPGSYTTPANNVPYSIKVAPYGWQHHSELADISMGNHSGATGVDDGEIVFKTTQNAHSSTTGLVERLRIDSSGDTTFYGNPSIDARDLYYKNEYATGSWTSSNWYTVVPHGLTSNSTYLVVLVWDFGGSLGQPYYLATQQLYSTVNGTNGTGSDNEMTPMVSTHTGGSGAKINCRVLAQASGTPAMQVNLSWGQGTNSYLRVKVWKMLFANRSA